MYLPLYVLRGCREKLGVDIRSNLEYQILTDFLISNNDRHYLNFGMLRYTDSLQWKGMCPIFDSGNSLFFDYSEENIPVSWGLLNLKVNSFGVNTEMDLLRYVKNRKIVNLAKLPSKAQLGQLLHKYDSKSSRAEKNKILNSYLMKIMFLKDFQNGVNIWEDSYKSYIRSKYKKGIV